VLFAYSHVERLLGVEISAFLFPETKVAEAWERYSQTLEPDRGFRGRENINAAHVVGSGAREGT